MQVVIAEPSLCNSSGHMLGQACALAEALKRAGYSSRLLAHAGLPDYPDLEGVTTERVFSVTPYDTPFSHAITGRMQSHDQVSLSLASEIRSVFHRFRHAQIIVPTINATMLSAIVRALIDLGPEAARLRLHLCLHLECGLALNDDGALIVTDSWLAWTMHSAFKSLNQLCLKGVHLLGVSAEMARIYEALSDAPVKAVPSIHPLRRMAEGEVEIKPQVLLYAGQASNGKGFGRLTALAPLVAAAFPETRVVVQLFRVERPDHAAIADSLRLVATSLPNLHLIEGHIPDAELTHLINESHVIALAYDRAHYQGKSSGFLWEAVAAGRMVVVPGGTWMAREASDARGAVVTYGPETPEAILEAIGQALAQDPASVPPATLQWGPDSFVTQHLCKVAPPAPSRRALATGNARSPRTPDRQLDLGHALAVKPTSLAATPDALPAALPMLISV